ncbi:uncharacterized protein C3orf14 homolog isoform X1 [Oxyura jamaicensis]|uniref:uncharacterized protein C3orf14 homolog isoform X1 n=2 Tax=Oxyura jamaicensis TaxID=8884 RepID=UPI0015A6A86C|nr:uncharacterized protein C3orf14 homolog isoform X1 [Oxyura jamaicensis]
MAAGGGRPRRRGGHGGWLLRFWKPSKLKYSDKRGQKMSSYLAQEVHLARRHEEILSQRSVLLQQMETYLGDKKTKKTWQTQAADAARKRNAALLNLGESEPEPILVCLSTGMAADGSIPTGLCAPEALPACEAWQRHGRDQALPLDSSGPGVSRESLGSSSCLEPPQTPRQARKC